MHSIIKTTAATAMDGASKQQNYEIMRNDVHAAFYEQLTVYDLNDDCLECIFERVPHVSNQIQIAKCSQRFHDVVVGLWRRQSHLRILMFNNRLLAKLLGNYGDLKYYLTAMRAKFHTLHIFNESLIVFLKEMDNCDIQCFPCVERCEFREFLTHSTTKDSEIEALSKLVPNLKYLAISGPITGKHLTNFQYLEELLLYLGPTKEKEMEAEGLGNILLNLKHLRVLDMRLNGVSSLRLTPEITQCTTLEVLKLNFETFKPMLNEVLQLPQLKQLTVQLGRNINTALLDNELRIYETREFHEILQQKGPQIHGISVDFCNLPVSLSWSKCFSYLRPENLKFLALCDTQFNVNEYSECHFARLETLCLNHTVNLKPLNILKMLYLCPVLKHLDISYCPDLPISLLRDILHFLQNEKRLQVLCLYYRMSGLESKIKKNISFWNAQKNLKLIEDFPPESEIGLSYVRRGFGFYF